MPTSADVITAEAPGAWITVANRRGQGQKPLGQRKLIRSDESGQFPDETQKKEGEQVAKWEKLDDCPLKTENYGDYGYIYQDTVWVQEYKMAKQIWVAVTIFDNGDEMDTPCDTKAEAKQVVVRKGE